MWTMPQRGARGESARGGASSATVHAHMDQLNADVLAFVRERESRSAAA